jgi:oligopeptide/dipeptide ABC transporter ATP-binding protein
MLLDVMNLKTYFDGSDGPVRAVDGVSFKLAEGEVLGLVGESGCGKTVTALSIMGIVPQPGRVVAGEILFKGKDLRLSSGEELRRLRGSRISMIFQEPLSSLNPLFTVGYQIEEAIFAHRKMGKGSARDLALELLKRVEIHDAQRVCHSYPHTLSGGLRQRAMLAMALANGPDLLIADEPTTALDVTIQKEILELLMRLKRGGGMSILFITHNFSIIDRVADHVGVMYLGRIVEFAEKRAILTRPLHPYTRALLDSIPRMGTKRLRTIPGGLADEGRPEKGCPFASRCGRKKDLCEKAMPPYDEVGKGHFVACFNFTLPPE